jgi:hypothetical protein
MSSTRKCEPRRPAHLFAALPALVICAGLLQSGEARAQSASTQAQAEAQAQQALPQAPQAAGAAQQVAPGPKKKSRNPTGSPLDTLLSTRLWADVPEAKDFVKETRPSPETLEFKPTAGTDPQRPKPRTNAELDALRSELESAGQQNQARGASLTAAAHPPAVKAAQNGKLGEPKKAVSN